MFHLDVAKVDLVLHILQWLYMYVASICFKYFNCFKRMLQVFYLNVVYVTSVCFKYFSCFKCMLQMFYLDVAIVAVVIHICWKRMF
jgi:hypothetical protein